MGFGSRPDVPDDPRSDDPDGGFTRFRSVFDSHYQAIYRYVFRRLAPDRSDVPDVTAEVFTVAWKRRGSLPAPPEDLLWLYGVARRVVSRHQRGLKRRERLHARLAGLASSPGTLDLAEDRDRVQSALARLRPADREALLLVLWEDLAHAEAARVLGCSTNAVGIRVHRAKKRLSILLDADQGGPDPGPVQK